MYSSAIIIACICRASVHTGKLTSELCGFDKSQVVYHVFKYKSTTVFTFQSIGGFDQVHINNQPQHESLNRSKENNTAQH
jgi:hypothetical protein